MKFLEKYKELGLQSEKEVFNYLIDNMKETIRTYDFYVAWDKVLKNVSDIEVSLNIMNSLIGKKDVEFEFKKLIKSYPEIVGAIPILIAVRDNTIKVATIDGEIDYSYKIKKNYTDEEVAKVIYFTKQCGILKTFEDRSIKNLVDYCIGVEVGLDTNARKNRSGKAMENLCEIYVKDICDKNGYKYIAQATVAQIKEQFNKNVPTDKSDRHFDFAIDTGDKVYLTEVNYYGGGGSKLKSVAGEFKSLYELVSKEPNVEFVWITDGKGWETAKRPLTETFNETDYIMNIKMIEEGLLNEVLTKVL